MLQWGRMASRFCCLTCYDASHASGRRVQLLRTTARQLMFEYYPIQDDVYGLTDDQKQVRDYARVWFDGKCNVNTLTQAEGLFMVICSYVSKRLERLVLCPQMSVLGSLPRFGVTIEFRLMLYTCI